MQNNLLSAGSTALGIVLAVLILLVMITIHEFGHYLAGKLLKFKINEFSIGFGPALFKRRSKKTGELFAIRLIPLGGYCSFADEDGLEGEKAAKASEEAAPAEENVFPDVEETSPADRTAPSNEPAAAEEPVSVQETVPSEEPAPVPAEKPSSEKTDEAAAPSGKGETGSFVEKKPWQRIIVLVAGALMNYLLSIVVILLLFSCYGQSLVMVRGSEVNDAYPAEYSFAAGDILLRANGKNLYLTTDIAAAINGKKEGEIVTFRVAYPTEDGYAEADREIKLRSDVHVKNSADVSGVWRALGIGVEELEDGRYYMLSSATYRFGFFETVGRSFVYSFKIAGSIFRVIGDLLTGRLGIDALGGPVTTISMTSRIAVTGFRNFLEITAYIGVNLAVFNLLPIPALDGSKVVFTLIEWIRKKPISRKVEAVIHAVGFILLLGFAVLVDILQFV